MFRIMIVASFDQQHQQGPPNSPHVILESTQMLVRDAMKLPPGVLKIRDGWTEKHFGNIMPLATLAQKHGK